LDKTNILIKSVTENFEKYRYSKAKQAKQETEQFFWSNFCDNYLEIVKKRVYQGKGNKKLSAQYTLYNSLLTILKMMAPIMPFVTEEIYQTYFKKIEKDKSIHISSWPKGKDFDKSDKVFDLMVGIISKVRKEKTKARKPMNSEIILTIDKKDKLKLKDVLDDLKSVTNSKEIKEGKFKVEFI